MTTFNKRKWWWWWQIDREIVCRCMLTDAMSTRRGVSFGHR